MSAMNWKRLTDNGSAGGTRIGTGQTGRAVRSSGDNTISQAGQVAFDQELLRQEDSDPVEEASREQAPLQVSQPTMIRGEAPRMQHNAGGVMPKVFQLVPPRAPPTAPGTLPAAGATSKVLGREESASMHVREHEDDTARIMRLAEVGNDDIAGPRLDNHHHRQRQLRRPQGLHSAAEVGMIVVGAAPSLGGANGGSPTSGLLKAYSNHWSLMVLTIEDWPSE